MTTICQTCWETLKIKTTDCNYHLDPETNTELAQLDADDYGQAAMDADSPYTAAELDELAEQPGEHADNCACDACRAAFFDELDAQLDKRIARLKTSPATLLDDVATLPIFSLTCPRVADPGRFDPPQVSTDRQPALF